MPDKIPQDSIGYVVPETIKFDEPLELACGRTLVDYQLVIETYGKLNEEKNNAVLICHALSGHHHAAGYHSPADWKPGWWDNYIGPGKPIDTDRFFVVCPNNLGGCHGSTGPSSINSETGKVWGVTFPPLRARDWVNSQAKLADKLNIKKWAAVIGGSLGGMQAMRWALEFPDRINHAIVIASAMKLSAQNIAFNEMARNAIKSDPDFQNGNFVEKNTQPRNGLALARMIGHVTYLSDEQMGSKFGRSISAGSFQRGQYNPVEFEVESYLRHQGDAFSGSFDANSYLLMTKVLDYFDLAREYDNDPIKAFSVAECDFLIISFLSDWRFSSARSEEIVSALIDAKKNVSYAAIQSNLGHDAFLLKNKNYEKTLATYMNRILTNDRRERQTDTGKGKIS
jgi:homoserine O-acetyltransferase